MAVYRIFNILPVASLSTRHIRARDIACNNICPWNSDMYSVNMELAEGQYYYDSLFELYASWGIDFIKVDDIANSTLYGCHKKEIA